MPEQIKISASQLEEFRTCPRKWYFNKCQKLPAAKKSYFVFGTVLASVLERYLKANDLGYDETGKPVDLYPPNWHIAFNKFTKQKDGEISPIEQDLIQRLVTLSISVGVLQRKPNRKIEHEFDVLLLEDTEQQIEVRVIGAIDCLLPSSVEDHKSTKASRWIKSKRELAENTQMLVYGKICLLEAEAEGRKLNPTDTVLFAHNVYVKDPNKPQIKRVEVFVTAQDIEDHWARLIEDVRHMLTIKYLCKGWGEIPPPKDVAGTCNAYGGCDFIPICTGMESVDSYLKRLKQQEAVKLTLEGQIMSFFTGQPQPNQPQPLPPPPAPAPSMGFINSPEAVLDVPNGQYVPPPTNIPTPVAPPVIPTGSPTPTPPPWADPTCQACLGTGFSSNGQFCPICQTRAGQNSKPRVDQFKINYNVYPGHAVWEHKDFPTFKGISPLPNVHKIVTNIMQAQPQANPEPQPQPQPQPQPTPPPQANIEPQPQFQPQANPEPQPQQPPQPPQPQPQQFQPQPTYVPQPQPPHTPQPQPQSNIPPAVTGQAEITLQPRGRGRPPKSFTLLMNCGIVKSNGKENVDIPTLLYNFLLSVANTHGKEKIHDLDPTTRTNAILQNINWFIGKLGTQTVAVPCGYRPDGGGDLETLVNALYPHADMIISPLFNPR